jgi:hypothetical protein
MKVSKRLINVANYYRNLKHDLLTAKERAAKHDIYRNCTFVAYTAMVLERELADRDSYKKYDDRDEFWLTKRSTRYSSKSYNYILTRLIEEGDVPIPEHKDISRYSIRHGVTTYWANHVGPHHAKEQLRHKSMTSTMKYLHSDAETRGKAVEKSGEIMRCKYNIS